MFPAEVLGAREALQKKDGRVAYEGTGGCTSRIGIIAGGMHPAEIVEKTKRPSCPFKPG